MLTRARLWITNLLRAKQETRIERNETGLLIEKHSPEAIQRELARLYSDPSLRERLGCAAALRIRSAHSLEINVRSVMELYSGLLAS